MHEELWAGADLKIAHAAHFLTEMQRSLDPPERTAWTVAQESAGAIVGGLWHRSFYANVDAFLAMARSVPEIIHCCFGADKSPQMRPWFDGLEPTERARRETFSSAFKPERVRFRTLRLTAARDISLHRSGVPSVQAKMTGHFGVTYVGSPIEAVPIAESPRVDVGAEPILQIAAARQHVPLRPKWSDFTIDGKLLFEECRNYLNEAQGLMAKARAIAQAVHGADSLTPPP